MVSPKGMDLTGRNGASIASCTTENAEVTAKTKCLLGDLRVLRGKCRSLAGRQSALRHELQNLPALVGQQIDRAIGPLAHVAYRPVFVRQQPLLRNHLLAIELEAHEVVRLVTTDEEVALPRGKQVRRVERHPARGDDGVPIVDRLLHPRLRGD